MDKYEAIEQLRAVIGEYLSQQGFVLADIIYRHEGRDLMLRVFADRPKGGITIEECATLNSGIGAALDEKGVPEAHYVLEVSSPGVDRPLVSREDFARCPDKKVRVFLKEQQDGKWEIEGVIRNVTDEILHLELNSGGAVEIPLARINKAKQMIK